MEKNISFDVIKKDFGLTIKQQEAIINFIHSLILDDASMKRIYNEIMTKNCTQKELYFALFVVGFYMALLSVGVIIE